MKQTRSWLTALGAALAGVIVLAIPPADAMPASPATSGQLYGVSCVKSNDCFAVGDWYDTSSNITNTLAEVWNGTAWKTQSIPNPVSSLGNLLYDIACSGPKVCVAVGVDFGPDTPILEQWNGSKWTLEDVKLPVGATNGFLYSVSCGSTTSCMVGGFYQTLSKADRAYALHWNGKSWSTSSPKSPSTKFNDLQALSCPTATSCIAVGQQESPSKIYVTLGELWNGSTWSVKPTPSASSGSSLLTSLACEKTSCLAVGYSTESGYDENLAAAWNGTKWSNVTVPDPSPRAWNQLLSVSCSSSPSCQAVGAYESSTAETQSLAVSWKDNTFAVKPTPAAGSLGYGLSGVSCAAASSCLAVGWSQAKIGESATVAESWNGSKWVLLHMPNP